MGTAVNDAAWIRRFHPGPEGVPLVVCLPHAGGSASFYHPLSAALAPHAEMLAVQYPGRQDRRSEPFAATIDELADRIAAALRPWRDRPLALFGHSMGALVAFETARRLDDVPVLFASGRRAPSLVRPETVHARDDAGLLAELRHLAGTQAELLGDEELLGLILPSLRADYAALDAYRLPADAEPLDCPVTVLVGDADPVTPVEEARAWEAHTTGPFDLRVLPGGHFFVADQRAAVAALILDGLGAGAAR
ncbi:Linear gramicidin dehydrogenase LgrE [Actinomadura rubteroloni]|uniref:Linear gramicidin dehydrogenase LgrE n=1 Tax=Actinomadura rubteroloni TaxID=1926885 RepID=A0A2P4UBW5_9ACTN|nr:Linear gramicidin dehydrogenase LgrE [Actinomadura rubteroloni]